MGSRKENGNNFNELLYLDDIRKIGHNEIVKVTPPVLISWHDGRLILCGDFKELNNNTKADRYPIPTIPHAIDNQEKAKYITKMDWVKVFDKNGVKQTYMKLLSIICQMDIYKYTKILFGINTAPSQCQRIMYTIFLEDILDVLMVVYSDDIIIYSEAWKDHLKYIDRF
ncbi:hypothetical protein O181_099343 [Austropuccinia psidii MF-1]|uniref:Reverse transcriptase domain-containing protein n=1 Tax=Austropuccinia psidii MF-1 TaxID=1389203 RepID=A0A9Q3JAV4_9BASI|nr:hypothetical protein [Austropuccinia psidii MF-1]